MARTFTQDDNLPVIFPTSTTLDDEGNTGELEAGDTFLFVNENTFPAVTTVYTRFILGQDPLKEVVLLAVL